MKIVCELKQKLAGLFSVFKQSKHHWTWWKPNIPVYDVFDVIQPGLIITEGNKNGLIEKVITTERLNIEWLHFHTQEDVNGETEYFYNWYKDGTLLDHSKTGYIPPLVDDIMFHRVEYNQGLASDIMYIGPRCTEILRLCYPVGRYNIKIASNDPEKHFPTTQYLGFLNLEETLQLYSSSKLCYARNIDDALKATACGTPVISINKEISKWMPSAIITDLNNLEICIGNQLLKIDDGKYDVIKLDKKYTYQNFVSNTILA